MIDCESVREWLPWYVSGRLQASRMQRMATHVSRCHGCQAGLARLIALHHEYVSSVNELPVPEDRMWDALERQLGEPSRASIDVGSFLIGLSIGIAARDRAGPVQGDLRVLGRRVRIIGRRTKGA
jgi:anti-sigma factor RsiW